MKNITVQKIHPDAIIPTKAHEDDLGWDLYVPVDTVLYRGLNVVDTGLCLQFDKNIGGIIKDRSSLASRNISVSGGVIDPSYTGPIKIILTYAGEDLYYLVNKGQRIAQLVLQECIHATFTEGVVVANESRNTGGFGSTGS